MGRATKSSVHDGHWRRALLVRPEAYLTLGVLVAVVAATIVLFVAVPRSHAVAATWDVDCSTTQFTQLPDWLPRSAQAEIVAGIARLGALNLQGDLSSDELRDSLLHGSPWFREVTRAQKRYPRKLQVRLGVRRPLALLEAGAGLLPLDREGVVLPASAAAIPGADARPLPHIRGTREPAVILPGTPILLAEVREGLAVAEEIQGLPPLVTIEAIDVANVPRAGTAAVAGRPEVVLETREGVPLWWGRSRLSPNFGALEIPVEMKVRHLRTILEQYPHLDGLDAAVLYWEDARWFPRRAVVPAADEGVATRELGGHGRSKLPHRR
ncbi:MAG: hypothetical protein U1E76_20635 [Planctomycetota bacterium]